ncbi:MAG: phytanoyl-CoA dioxygenase family protein [Solirubrobacteraceae bacterium]
MTTGSLHETRTTPPLGVPQLERLRRSIVGERERPREPLSEREFAVTKAVLDSLGIGLEPVHVYMYRAMPTLEELERWVLTQVGGSLDPRRLHRANAIASGAAPDAERLAELERINQTPPALSGQDLEDWERDGYVVLRDAAPAPACAQLEQAIWKHLRARPDDPDSWYRAELQQGIMVALFHAPGIEAIHASPRIHKAFAQLAGTADLVMTADRCGFNPPVRPGFPYKGARLHFDLGSFEPPIAERLQGILYLSDTDVHGGAFRCVPGFHRRIDEWLAGLTAERNPNLLDLELLGPKPIAGRRGDLIVWRSTLPHGPSPHTGPRPRIVHYLTMYPTPRLDA